MTLQISLVPALLPSCMFKLSNCKRCLLVPLSGCSSLGLWLLFGSSVLAWLKIQLTCISSASAPLSLLTFKTQLTCTSSAFAFLSLLTFKLSNCLLWLLVFISCCLSLVMWRVLGSAATSSSFAPVWLLIQLPSGPSLVLFLLAASCLYTCSVLRPFAGCWRQWGLWCSEVKQSCLFRLRPFFLVVLCLLRPVVCRWREREVWRAVRRGAGCCWRHWSAAPFSTLQATLSRNRLSKQPQPAIFFVSSPKPEAVPPNV